MYKEIDPKWFNKTGIILGSAPKEIKQEYFILRANEVHNNKYDYSLVRYYNNNTKVTIKCPVHGEFMQLPRTHLSNGRGCPKCAGKHKHICNEFITLCHKAHNNKYDYSLIETTYTGIVSRITIICPIHGEFEQFAANHLHQKQGCPSCSRRDVNSSKGLYVVYSPSLSVYKVGITNNIKSRIYTLNNYNKGESFELVKFFDFKNSHHAKLLERYFHFLFKEVQAHDLLPTSIHGKTELFYLDRDKLAFIDTYVKSYCQSNNLTLG